jgi:hydrogenase maturation protease
MPSPLLIFAIGNESRGDDALAPLLLRQLAEKLAPEQTNIELLEEFQLQIEHTLDMQQRQLILFIDAGIRTPAPFCFYRAQAAQTPPLLSHALTPETLLQIYSQHYGEPAPSFVLCLRGESFELGETLSEAAQSNLSQAVDFIEIIANNPQLDFWEARCQIRTPESNLAS